MNRVFSSRALGAVTCMFLATVVCGCTLMAKKQEEYKNARTLQPLNVPPGLTKPPPDNETLIPKASVPKTPGSAAPNLAAPPIVALESSDIQVQSDGALYWLVVRESDDDAWLQILDFWERDGIALAYESPGHDVMETVWLSQETPDTNGQGSTSGSKASGSRTVTQNMFRVRLEHYPDTGGTDIFITCRSRGQVSGGGGGQWVPLPANPALEVDMMNRLLAFLGGSAAGTQKVTIKEPGPGYVKLIKGGAQPSLVLAKPLDMAWRHVGQALDRIGFTLVSQDRLGHKYLITLGGPPPKPPKKPGWWSRLFFSNKDNKPSVPVYSVSLTPGKDSATVVTTGVDPGTGADPGRARKILDEIYEELS